MTKVQPSIENSNIKKSVKRCGIIMYGQFTNYCAKHNIHDYVNDLLIGDESRFDWTGIDLIVPYWPYC